MVRDKRFLIVMVFISLFGIVVFGEGAKNGEAKGKGGLKEQVLDVYQTNGAKGVRDFMDNIGEQITPKFIIDLAKVGVKEENREWLDIALIMAENRMDEETQVEVYYQIRKYIGRISGVDKEFPFLKSANSRLSPAEECMVKGMVYFSFGDDQKTLEMYEKALAFYKKTGNPLGHWWLYLNMGDIYFFKGDNSTALSMYRTAVSDYDQGMAGRVEAVIKKAKEYRKARKYEEALKELNKALVKFHQKKYRKKLQIERADLYHSWAVNFKNKHDYARAIKYWEMVYAIDKIYRPKKAVRDLNNIAFLYSAFSQKCKALEYYEIALSTSQAMGYRLGEARILLGIGAIYSDLSQHQKALRYFEKALPICKVINDRVGEAVILNNIGGAYISLNQNLKALEFYEKALTIQIEEGNQYGEAVSLNNIGGVYNENNQYQKALEYYGKALLIKKALGDRAGEATTLNNIGAVYIDLGQKPKALEYYEKALPIQRAVGDRATEAKTLNNIGVVYDALGQKRKALEYFEKALPINQALGNRAMEATTLNNIGAVYYTLRQNQKALEHYEKALPISQAVGDRSGEAMTLTNIGSVYDTLGQKHKALEYYEKALLIQRAVGDRAREVITLNNLMGCWDSLKNQQSSIFYGKQSVNTFQYLRSDNSVFKRVIKKSYHESYQYIYRRLARVLIDKMRNSEAQHVLDMIKEKEYFEFIGKGKSTTPTYSQLDFTKFEKQWLDKYKEVTKDYSSISGDYHLLNKNRAKSDEEKKRLKELKASLKQFREDYDKYLKELKIAFDKYNKTVKKETVTTPKTQERFRERQSILRELDKKEGGKNVFLNFLVQEERVAVIFTTPDSQFVRFSDVRKKKLNRLIIEYRKAIETRNKAPQKGMANDFELKTIYGKLYDAIFKPVDIELKKMGATNLMVYLDGLLRYLPLNVLWDGENYLIQRYRISRFTTASFDRIKREPEAINNILGLGASLGGEGFDPLPNVKDEIQGIVRDKGKGFDGIINGKAFLDNDFTRETFVNQLKTASYPLVHISSHFSFNSGGETADETKSHLLMGDGTKMNLKEIREHKGLFKGVELLVLSACETGMGDADGQEIDGFGELAQQSGAQCVVASLWKVRDESTKELMVNFYRSLEEGKVTSKIEALRQAQMELAGLEDLLDKNKLTVKRKRTKYAHPFFWGPFIMIGNWR